MVFLALAIDIGAGIALYEARRWSASGEDGGALRCKLAALREEMIDTGHALWLLENEGAIFENQFWRDFYRSLLNGAKRGAIQKLTVILLGVALLSGGRLFAADRLNLVILVDLSQSVATKDYDSKAEFQKNVDGVTRLLASLPAGSRLAIFGVTSDSFGTPYPLLRAELSGDEGYFKERLATGRAELMRAWHERSATLKPQFPHTDLLGAMLVAAQYFEESPGKGRKLLVIFSDMRQSTRVLDFEHGLPQTQDALRQVATGGLMADLCGVEVRVLGVDASGVSIAYWQNLRGFWTAYFRDAGASLQSYSILREEPPIH
jgi:hypothetical protein